MSEESVWDRQENEDAMWYDRFLLHYVALGPSRTKLAAVHSYEEELNKKADESGKKRKPLSKKVPGAWDDAAFRWRWKERAETYDDYRRRKVFAQGNAHDVVRVEKLNGLTERLEAHIARMLENLESPDYLEKAKAKPWFNAFLLERYYQGLEALAAETGGRVKKQDINLSFSEEQEQAEQELNQALSQFVRGETNE